MLPAEQEKKQGGPPGMRQGRLIATGAMLAFCLFALWQSLLLSLTDRLGPGPGFFPFWLALIGAVFAIALLFTTFREPNDPADPEVHILPHGPGVGRWLAIVVLIAVTAAVMEFIGFRLAMLCFNAALVIALGERRWWLIGVFAAGGSFGVYYVFTRWLDVLLPDGTIWS
jgi:putative tricarboxylic transport membrane protein